MQDFTIQCGEWTQVKVGNPEETRKARLFHTGVQSEHRVYFVLLALWANQVWQSNFFHWQVNVLLSLRFSNSVFTELYH